MIKSVPDCGMSLVYMHVMNKAKLGANVGSLWDIMCVQGFTDGCTDIHDCWVVSLGRVSLPCPSRTGINQTTKSLQLLSEQHRYQQQPALLVTY